MRNEKSGALRAVSGPPAPTLLLWPVSDFIGFLMLHSVGLVRVPLQCAVAPLRTARHSSEQADEQSRATGRGAGGAKGGGRGECRPAKHVPGTEPGKRANGAGTKTGR